MAVKPTKIDELVFDQAVEYLYDEGRLFDRDDALGALRYAHLDLEDGAGWQKRVSRMDAEEMATFIKDYYLDPMDEFNRTSEDAYQENLKAEM